MNNKEMQIADAVRSLGQGVPFHIAHICARSGASRKTVKRYLDGWREAGWLGWREGVYHNSVKQGIYWRLVEPE